MSIQKLGTHRMYTIVQTKAINVRMMISCRIGRPVFGDRCWVDGADVLLDDSDGEEFK